MKGCVYEIDEMMLLLICLLLRWICRSFLSVVLSFYDFFANLVEELINCVHVLISWGFNRELAIGHILLEVLREDCGYSSALCQITFAPNDDNEHFSRLALQMLVPLAELVERLLIIDSVAQHSNTGIVQEEVSQVVDRGVASSIPNIELHLVIANVDKFSIVLQ